MRKKFKKFEEKKLKFASKTSKNYKVSKIFLKNSKILCFLLQESSSHRINKVI